MAVAKSDGEVIAASLDRPARFEAIFDRHAASVHRYLRRRVGDALAEELTAETFMRAFRNRAQFDTSCPSSLPWLYGIAVNLIRMHVRSEQRRERAYQLAEQNQVQPSSTAEADARLDAQALVPTLNAALADLSQDEREVLLLHAWAGLAPSEIAQALSLSGAIVRKRLHRARAKATERLEQHEQQVLDPLPETRTPR